MCACDCQSVHARSRIVGFGSLAASATLGCHYFISPLLHFLTRRTLGPVIQIPYIVICNDHYQYYHSLSADDIVVQWRCRGTGRSMGAMSANAEMLQLCELQRKNFKCKEIWENLGHLSHKKQDLISNFSDYFFNNNRQNVDCVLERWAKDLQTVYGNDIWRECFKASHPHSPVYYTDCWEHLKY